MLLFGPLTFVFYRLCVADLAFKQKKKAEVKPVKNKIMNNFAGCIALPLDFWVKCMAINYFYFNSIS